MLGPHSRRLITRSGYLKSKKLWHVLQEAVTEEPLKGAGTDSAHQGAEQIGGSLIWGPSESQHFDATIYLLLLFSFCPQNAKAEKQATRKSKGHIRLYSYLRFFGPSHTWLQTVEGMTG